MATTKDCGQALRLQFGALALLFAVAQLLFAAHVAGASDHLADHVPQNCEYCLAGAMSDDPSALDVVITAPPPAYLTIVNAEIASTPTAFAVVSLRARSPPSC